MWKPIRFAFCVSCFAVLLATGACSATPEKLALFGHPFPLSRTASTSGADFVSQVTTDGQGTWVAVWHSLDSLGGTIGTDRDILVARSTDNGATWTAPVALNTNAASDAGGDRANKRGFLRPKA